MRLIRTLVLAALPSVVLLAALAPPSAAENSFSGTCTFENWVDFWPRQTAIPQPTGYYSRGTGPCKGMLNGAPFDGTATLNTYANMHTDMGCTIGNGPNAGPGYMTFLTGAGNRAASPGTATQPPPRQHSKKRKSHHKKRKKSRHAAVRAAASDPPRDPSQPAPRPPAPTFADPTIEVWQDIVTSAPNLIAGDMRGAYRGYAVGAGNWEGDPAVIKDCFGDGLAGSASKVRWATVNELRG